MRRNLDFNTPKALLEDIIRTYEETVKEEKKFCWHINIVSITVYIFLIFFVKKVTMLSVISTSFLVTSHYYAIWSSIKRKGNWEVDAKIAESILKMRKDIEDREMDSDNSDNN